MTVEATQQGRPQIARTRTWRRRAQWLRRLPYFALFIMAAMVFTAIFADVIAPHSPYSQNLVNRFLPPAWMDGGTWTHPLGTDQLGRDSLSRLIHGTRITLTVAVVVLLIGGVTGLLVGMLAGYFGGWPDVILMRLTDAAIAIPGLFLAILFAVTLGPSFTTVIIALSAVLWSHFARIIRGEVLRVRDADFVALARVAGRPHRAILIRHILPNIMNTWIVVLSLQIGIVILAEASLGFLGAGIPPPRPSWGALVADGRGHIGSRWWLSFFPGAAITLVVLAFNMFGDWLRDTLDPKLRQT